VASRSELSDRVASFPGKFRAPIARLAHFPDRRNDIPRALSPCVSRISRRRDPPSALPSPPARHKFRFSRPPGSGDTDPRNPRYCNFYPTPLQDPYGSLDVSPMPRRSLSSLPPPPPSPSPRNLPGLSPSSGLQARSVPVQSRDDLYFRHVPLTSPWHASPVGTGRTQNSAALRHSESRRIAAGTALSLSLELSSIHLADLVRLVATPSWRSSRIGAAAVTAPTVRRLPASQVQRLSSLSPRRCRSTTAGCHALHVKKA